MCVYEGVCRKAWGRWQFDQKTSSNNYTIFAIFNKNKVQYICKLYYNLYYLYICMSLSASAA